MYACLWWKDARQFWPIWVVLLLAAAATQWLMLILVGRPVRFGALGVSALLWAGLYGLAAGAAAFAGERETGTLRLLDVLPADRRVVWAGKFSFALVTTLILMIVLLVMAALSTESWNQHPLAPSDAVGVSLCVLVALGWGLFWSSILKSALTSALAAMCCVGLTLGFLVRDVNFVLGGGSSFGGQIGIAQLVVIIVTVAASRLFFTGTVHVGAMNFRVRSPVVYTGSRPWRLGRAPRQLPVAAVLSPSPRPIAVLRPPQASTAAPSARRSWRVETGALVWQTVKEGKTLWSMLAAIAVAHSAWLYTDGGPAYDRVWLLTIDLVIVLAAGASGFGLENRARTYRFLVHHGARTGSVWLVKVMTWSFGLALIAVPQACFIGFTGSGGLPNENLAPAFLSLPLAYAIAVTCGMAFRRGITAFVIALVLTLALAAPLLALVYMNMLPAPATLVVAAAILAVSWAWRGDWMLERPAPARWVRLGLFVTGTLALLSAFYISFRVWSVPDVGPIAPPAAWAEASTVPLSPEHNAAPLYLEADRRLIVKENPQQLLRHNKLTLDLIRRAAARPDCRFDRPRKPTVVHRLDIPPAHVFSKLVSQAALEGLERGDLAGSWDDIMVLFRMTRHFTERSGVGEAMFTLSIVERDALGSAISWAVAKGQTTERLHAALEAYRNLPELTSPTDIVRAEANIIENTLDLPASTLRRYLEEFEIEPWPHEGTAEPRHVLAIGLINLFTTPWELAHARRVNRLVSASALESAGLAPGRRLEAFWHSRRVSEAGNSFPSVLRSFSRSMPEYFAVDEQNEVARRALVQILAIHSWQLKHDGRFPDSLDALVPDELPSLPNDPYSDRPFGYIPSNGGALLPLKSALAGLMGTPDAQLISPEPGSRLLYSVGHDRRDNGGNSNTRTFPGRDLVFAIPPVGNTAGVENAKAESTPTAPVGPEKPK